MDTKGNDIFIKKLHLIVKPYEFVSFDIFDTLIKRNVNNPTDIFLIVQKKFNKKSNKLINNFLEKRKEAAVRATNLSNKNEITLDDIYEYFSNCINKNELNQLKTLEMETELEFCQINKRIENFYNYCLEQGKKILLISDTYLPRFFIETMLEKNNIRKYQGLYVSSEYGITKASGKLIQFVLKELKIKGKELCHIGDNFRSDILIPRLFGIKTFYVNKNFKYTQFEKIEKRNKDVEKEILHSFINNNYPIDSSYYFQVGYEAFGIALYGFSQWIIENIKKDGLDTIYFLSRDGYIVKKVFDIINNNPNIISKYLYVSRRSLSAIFLSTIKSPKDLIKEKIIFIRRYETKKSLLQKLGLKPNDYLRNSEEANELVKREDIYSSTEFMEFFDKIYDDVIYNALIERENLKGYLNENIKSSRFGIVDVGWHGSVQDNLGRFYKEVECSNKEIMGYYFGLLDKNQKWNKNSFIFNKNSRFDQNLIFGFNGLIETFFTALHGSCLKYQKIQNDYIPVLENLEHDNYNSYIIQDVHDGALKFVEDFHKIQEFANIDISYELAFSNFYSLLTKPRMKDVLNFKDMVFYDVKFKKLANPKSLLKYFCKPKQFLIDYSNSDWKIGFLKSMLKLPLPYDKIVYYISKFKKNTIIEGKQL